MRDAVPTQSVESLDNWLSVISFERKAFIHLIDRQSRYPCFKTTNDFLIPKPVGSVLTFNFKMIAEFIQSLQLYLGLPFSFILIVSIHRFVEIYLCQRILILIIMLSLRVW